MLRITGLRSTRYTPNKINTIPPSPANDKLSPKIGIAANVVTTGSIYKKTPVLIAPFPAKPSSQNQCARPRQNIPSPASTSIMLKGNSANLDTGVLTIVYVVRSTVGIIRNNTDSDNGS